LSSLAGKKCQNKGKLHDAYRNSTMESHLAAAIFRKKIPVQQVSSETFISDFLNCQWSPCKLDVPVTVELIFLT